MTRTARLAIIRFVPPILMAVALHAAFAPLAFAQPPATTQATEATPTPATVPASDSGTLPTIAPAGMGWG